MSQLLQVATRSGAISTTSGTVAPDHIDQGIPFEADGSLAIDVVSGIDHHYQGLPYSDDGRLVVALNGAVDYIGNGAAPFSSAGRLAMGTGAVDHHSAGIPYTATSQIAIS